MFFKKKKSSLQLGQQPTQEESLSTMTRFTTIPEAFYGGANPAIYTSPSSSSRSKILEPIDSSQKPSLEESAQRFAELPGQQSFLSNLTNKIVEKKKLVLILSGILLFVAVTAGASWYYVNEANKARRELALKNQPSNVDSGKLSEEGNEPPTSTPEVIITTTTETPTSTPPNIKNEFLQIPKINFGDTTDLDNDSLTDLEEELFGSDSGKWDTDGDGYYDGQEVINLYNPKGVAPIRIIDSGLVREYINPIFRYRSYLPSSWEVGAVDAESKQVLFSAVGGDYIEIFVADKMESETFLDWFARSAPGQEFSDLKAFKNRFTVEGYRRGDSLVAYFPEKNRVYVILYHEGGTQSIAYRHAAEMMFQSFRPETVSASMPEQAILPPLSPVVPNIDQSFENQSTDDSVEGQDVLPSTNVQEDGDVTSG